MDIYTIDILITRIITIIIVSHINIVTDILILLITGHNWCGHNWWI